MDAAPKPSTVQRSPRARLLHAQSGARGVLAEIPGDGAVRRVLPLEATVHGVGSTDLDHGPQAPGVIGGQTLILAGFLAVQRATQNSLGPLADAVAALLLLAIVVATTDKKKHRYHPEEWSYQPTTSNTAAHGFFQ
jgi:hypothetical protein